MKELTLDAIVALCKARGFVFQSSEIYGGLSSAWDYGPLGIELKRNLQDAWWRAMTRFHDNIVGLDAAILMHPKVWEASGHVENFHDPMVDCKVCRNRFRADHIDVTRACTHCGAIDSFTEARQFNLMFKTHIGAVENTGTVAYLRPETAQGIFVNYKNIVQSSRMKVPFGVAQIGKAFRNEIVTRNFIFRTCEFEQMEMQFFVKPGTDEEHFAYWKQARMEFYRTIGINMDKLREHKHGVQELAHYAKDAYDIEYQFPFGWQELEGIHNRSDYDIQQHMQHSGKDLRYTDLETRAQYIPYVIETSAGLTRMILMTLCDAYEVETLDNGEVRTVLRFHPRIAPVTVAVFPLMKKDGLPEIARRIQQQLSENYVVQYDQNGAIGRRYRRYDEIGTPYCITVDYETKDTNTVTMRLRDSMKQIRVPIAELSTRIHEYIQQYVRV